MRPLSSRTIIYYLSLLCVAALFLLNVGYLRNQSSSSGSQQDQTTGGSGFSGAAYDIALAFGDDLIQSATDPNTSGWLTHLSHFYDRRLDILSRGFAQYTSSDARLAAELILPKTNPGPAQPSWLDWFGWSKSRPQPPPLAAEEPGKWADTRERMMPSASPKLRLLILSFGTNDAAPEDSPWHVPLPMFAQNLRYIVSLLRSPESAHYSPHTRILFVTPPALGDRMHAEYMRKRGLPPTHQNQITRKYAETVCSVARDLDSPCVDLWTAMELMVKKATNRAPLAVAAREGMLGSDFAQASGKLRNIFDTQLSAISPFDGYEIYLSDGLHLNANGNKLLYKLVVSEIVTKWPELRPY
ncbi:isoamyl acetate-hydrolyzing esterase [Coemansia sp. IMI 209128]|nr:isoamyl acetate-hydrolyzing esterase [Coemansia sp. RSA 2530]KAJ2698762.1 isoamyl acetate-hydrolyzing esterase [Coemansia sp. IMI 209128]